MAILSSPKGDELVRIEHLVGAIRGHVEVHLVMLRVHLVVRKDKGPKEQSCGY
jgi:hypothetical protein